MTAKQKQAAEDAVWERVFDRIRNTSREEWLSTLKSYGIDEAEATAAFQTENSKNGHAGVKSSPAVPNFQDL